MPVLTTILLGVLPLLIVVCIALLAERVRPAEAQTLMSARFNLLYMATYGLAQGLIAPTLSVLTVVAINRVGGGWIVLPGAGWSLLWGFALYAITLDFMEYIFHRAQHRFPLMWAMHSFHHSDTAMNASTTGRHFWAENGIKMLTIYLAAGILFRANAAILGMYALLTFYHVFPHMNLRVGFGRWSFLMNSPQYHRIHHSVLEEHFDCNFAGLFPIFDVLSGAYRHPEVDEFPPTGLDTGARPGGLADAIIWPARGLLRK